MTSNRQYIGSWAVASPPLTIDQKEAEAFFRKHYKDRLSSRTFSVISKVFRHPSVLKRHFAIDRPETFLTENADEKMERFTRGALSLSSQAALAAMRDAGIEGNDITGIVANTCTGYICPGLSTYLVENLGLNRNILAYDLVGSGCGGAIPNLQICQALLKEERHDAILSISVEICSATYQMEDDLSLIVSNAIFGDGAAAAIVWNRPKGLALLATASLYAPEYRDDIRFVYQNGQLHNRLSQRLPKLVGRTVSALISDFLKEQGLVFDDIRHWILHNGGEKIIEAVKKELNLTEKQIQPTLAVLADYGNLSSATVWFGLEQIRGNLKPGELCLMIAFGAGLSAHVYLLKT